jgi:hypothetical protein
MCKVGHLITMLFIVHVNGLQHHDHAWIQIAIHDCNKKKKGVFVTLGFCLYQKQLLLSLSEAAAAAAAATTPATETEAWETEAEAMTEAEVIEAAEAMTEAEVIEAAEVIEGEGLYACY